MTVSKKTLRKYREKRPFRKKMILNFKSLKLFVNLHLPIFVKTFITLHLCLYCYLYQQIRANYEIIVVKIINVLKFKHSTKKEKRKFELIEKLI